MNEDIKKQFTHLKIHTQFSVCEGALKISELADYCKKNNIRSVGLCDSNNLCGALEFSEFIAKSKTQPIIGSQLNVKYKNEIGKIPLFAKSLEGYKNLIKLSSKSYLDSNEDEEPSCTYEDLQKNSEGLILLTGSFDGLIGKLFFKNLNNEIIYFLKGLKKYFQNNIYLEIQRHNDEGEKMFEDFLINISEDFDLPLIATNEVFYLSKDMHEAHDAYLCVGEKTYVNVKDRKKYSNQHYLKSSEEMYEIFKDLPDALINNENFPRRINFRPKNALPVLPEIGSNEKISVDDLLKNESKIGLKKKLEEYVLPNLKKGDFKEIEKKYIDRLDHEIKIISKMKYSSYFLIVSDYIKWAKKNDIPVGPGRGSGAGSLVAWSISITDIDPIKFDLIFERFLNPDRISMPDFDIDFCEEKRDQVFHYLKKKIWQGSSSYNYVRKIKSKNGFQRYWKSFGAAIRIR